VLRSAVILCAALGVLTISQARSADPPATGYRAGVAKIDITPEYPVRLAGFGFRRTESEGVTHRIRAEALAIDDGHDPLVLITADLCGIPATFTDELAKRLQSEGVRRDRLTLAVTHSHTTPMIRGYLPTLFGQPIPPEHQEHIDRYSAELLNHLTKVAKDALADRRPAKLDWGVGSVGFAINRRTKGGPTDHDLPALAVRDADGKLRAVWASYACHCVTLSNNKIGGDWAGFAKEAIEADHPGAVALISIGCGADQNPSSGVSGDKVEVAMTQGRELAGEVKRVVGGYLTAVKGPIVVRSHHLELPLVDPPPRATWEEKAKLTDPKQAAVAYHAKAQLARLDRGDPLTLNVTYIVDSWMFGESLALVFLPGEDVVDYSRRIKKEIDSRRVWVNAYCNSVPCYIPSERVLKEGGYEGATAMIYYDLPGPFKPGLESRICAAVRNTVGKPFRAPFDPSKTIGRPQSPQQSQSSIKMRPGLAAEVMAAEPLVASPVAIAFGPDGRLWVAEMYDYPSGTDGNFRPGGRIRVLTASKGDGHYDQSTVFLYNIPFPTGVTVWRNGVLICAAPDILYAEEVKDPASGVASAPRVKVTKLFSGFGTDNYQARVNSLEYGLDGWVYGSCGLFGGTITNAAGKKLVLGNRDFRIKPDTGEIEPATGRTQQGRVRDDWDNWFGCDNTHLAWHYPLPDHYVRRNPHAAPPNPMVLIGGDASEPLYPAGEQQLFKLSGPPGRPTAACGIGVYRDDLLGKDVTGDLFVCEPVNLLVHRMKLKPQGSTFAAVRPPGEEQSEFLTSTDQWFRPVQARTGPDGCLWVVDMHRYVIEHPRWIPPEDLEKLDVRAGATLGRIVRIRPTDREPRPFPRLDKLDNAGLVAALDSPNGWQRDLATQMLLWRNAKDMAPALAKLAAECPRPEARLQALCGLDGLGKLTPDLVRRALADNSPGIRRNAVRMTEQFAGTDRPVGSAFPLPVMDLDAQVRLQTACSLGEWKDPSSGVALLEIAFDQINDPYLTAAVLSSVRAENVSAFLGSLTKDALNRVPMHLLRPLVTTAVALRDRDGLSRMLQTAAAAPPSRMTMTVLAVVTESRERGDNYLPLVFDNPTRLSIGQMLSEARTLVVNPKADIEDRVAAVALLRDASDRKVLTGLLNAQQSAILQSAAATAIARIPGEETVTTLLADWPGYSPALRSQILDLVLSCPGGAKSLLDAIDQKTVPAAQLDAVRRQRLLSHKDAAVRERAAKLFAAAINPDRQKVVTAHHDVLKLTSDARRGVAVFANHCAVCHRLNGVGHEVGPDLAQLQNKSPAYLLQEILDPNRNVDSRYVEYRATTKSGRVLSGILHAESATSITLRAQQAIDQVLLREEVDALEGIGRSLMPEGLEKDLTKQDLADLVAYLGKPQP
jgi:putative membrane-bound dehydrogenase-like protein